VAVAGARLVWLVWLVGAALALAGCRTPRAEPEPAAPRPPAGPGAASQVRPAPESVMSDSVEVDGEMVHVACPADSAERARAIAAGQPPRFPSQVDQPAVERALPLARAGAATPPPAPAHAPGATTLRFVVDPSGTPEPGTITLIRSAGMQDAARACGAVLRARYEPGRIGGRAVRQWVERTYVF